VKDPHEVVKAGDVVKVRVVEVDIARKRIGLSMRKESTGGAATVRSRDDAPRTGKTPHPSQFQKAKPQSSAPQGALAAALAEAMKRK